MGCNQRLVDKFPFTGFMLCMDFATSTIDHIGSSWNDD